MTEKLDLRHLKNDIVSAAEQCIRQLSEHELEETTHEVLEDGFVRPDYCSFIPLQGDFKGYFLLGTWDDSIDPIIELMGAQDIPLQREKKLQVSLDELSNTISGRITTLINDWRDVTVEIGTPFFMKRDEFVSNEKESSTPTLRIVFELQSGELVLQLSLISRDLELEETIA